MAYATPLQAYLEQRDANQRASMGNLQQAGALQTMLSQAGAQQREAQAREIMASNATPEEKFNALSQVSPAHAHQFATGLKEMATVKAQQGLQSVDINSLLDNPQAALAAQAANPHIGPELERLRKVRENTAALNTMRRTKGEDGTLTGGHFAGLMESEIPAIANQARTAQAQLDMPNGAIPAQHWVDLQKGLAGQETKILETRKAAAERKTTPLSDLGKLKADLRAGRISQEDYDASVGKKTGKTPDTNLTPEAIDQAAARYALDGTLPPNLGRGTQGAANTALILNKAAEKATAAGDAGEAARLRQISNRASTTALGQLVKQKNMVLAFEKNAVMNADLALQQSEKVDRLGSPIVDRWLQAGQKNIAGDVEVAKLDAAIRTFVNEYARVTTSVTGGGVTSDSARKEIDTLLRGAHTKEQVRGVIGLMKQEMANRRTGYEQQEAELKRGITGTPTPADAAPSAPAPAAAPAALTPAEQQELETLRKRFGR